MSVLDRSALEASPLADLHTIASELSIDGYRRLRRAEVISAIIDKQSGGDGTAAADASAEQAPAEKPKPRRPTRARRTSRAAADDDEAADPRAAAKAEDDADTDAEAEKRPRARGERKNDARADQKADAKAEPAAGVVAAAEAAARPATRRSRAPTEMRSPAPHATMTAIAAPMTPTAARSRASRVWSNCSPVVRASCASIRPSPPTRTCTSPRRRSSAASWSAATG